MQAKKGKRPDETFPLNMTVKQRESLIHATRLSLGLKTRIEEASANQKFVEFTKSELEKLGDEIDASLIHVAPAHRKRLSAVLNKIGDLLADLVVKHSIEKRQAADKSGVIYQFKVLLKENHLPIWRRIQVPDCTPGKLHQVLQVVMGWNDSHLHQFIIRGEYYGSLDPQDMEWGIEKGDEEEISISQVAKTDKRSGSPTSTTLATDGSTRSSWKRPWNPSRRSSIPDASKGNKPAHRRIAAALGATSITLPPSLTRCMSNTRKCWNGGGSSTRKSSRWTR